jgi:mRNA-binding protein PUF3
VVRQHVPFYKCIQPKLTSVAGSDDASPTAPSGSAQLNHQSEAEPWGARAGFWKSQDAHASGNTSPTHTRDSVMAQHNSQESQYFQSRSAVGQNGGAFANRSKTRGSLDPSSNTFKYSDFGSSMKEEMENTASYQPSISTKYPFNNTAPPFKRSSQEPTFANLGQGRDSISRASEISTQTTPAHLHQDISQYPFETTAFSNGRNPSSRPGVPHHSISFPSNEGSARAPASSHATERDLPSMFASTLKLDAEAPNGLSTNGYANPASQSIQLSAASQPWTSEASSNARSFGQGYADHESYSDQIPAPYLASKRGSIERGSPATSLHRSSLNSPSYAPTPNPRADSWSGSRPISRNHLLTQEFERQQAAAQYQQNPSFYQNSPYYGNSFPSQYHPVNPYDLYNQNPGFRNPMPMPSYGVNFPPFMPPASIPARPRTDQDPGRGIRSIVLEDYRASNRSSKRFELKVNLTCRFHAIDP